jgi:hypothetical protein
MGRRRNIDKASYAQLMLALQGAGGGLLEAGLGNYAVINQSATTNAEGSGGPTTCALVCVTAQASGIFMWYASAVSAAAAADVSTWSVTSQTGTGAATTTGGGAPTGYFYGPPYIETAPASAPLVATAIAGTGIVITAGGGSSKIQYSRAQTIGTAAVDDSFSAFGIMQNSLTALGARVPFTRGSNVFLLLNYTNSVANRAVSDINLGIVELPF